MPHLWRQGFQQVPNPLLVFDINVKITHEHQATVRAYTFAAPAKLARLHVPLHDVDAILLIEGDAGDFIKADDIVLGNQAALPRCVVHKHAGNRCFTPRDQVGSRGNLLKEVGLARTARAKFDHIEVAVYEWNHPQ